MNANLKHIVTDGLILFTVSTVLVVLADKGFSLLKEKGVKDSEIVSAIHSGRIEEVRSVLARQPGSIHERDPHGRSPLTLATYANEGNPTKRSETDAARAAMIPDLLAAGAGIDHTDSDHWTPLMWAAWSGLSGTCEVLAAKGADVSAADVRGNTALMLAARRGHENIVSLLIQHGADRSAVNLNRESAVDLARTGLRESPAQAETFHRIIRALDGHPGRDSAR